MSASPLVSPESLPTLPAPWILLDCRAGAGAFASGHLPGALHADLDRALSTASEPGFDPASGGRHPLPPPSRWAAQLGLWGLRPETWVVACDDASGGSGAARAWWMLRASGHGRVAVLDGGLKAARAAGLPLTDAVAPPAGAPPYPVTPWSLPMVDLPAVDRIRLDPAWRLLDVRSPERWRGEAEPIDPVPGRIPGSLNFPWTESLGPDGRFKAPETLRRQFLDLLEDTPPARLAIHCGSGVTACQTLLALELAGLPGASVYMGSYSEWCRSGKPLARG